MAEAQVSRVSYVAEPGPKSPAPRYPQSPPAMPFLMHPTSPAGAQGQLLPAGGHPSQASSGASSSSQVSSSTFHVLGTTQGNPHPQPSLGPQACLGAHRPPHGAYLPQLWSREGGLGRTPSPWVGNYAVFCLLNQKHALWKGGEGNFVIGFN